MTLRKRQAISLVWLCALGAVVTLAVSLALAQDDSSTVSPANTVPASAGLPATPDAPTPADAEVAKGDSTSDGAAEDSYPGESVVEPTAPGRFKVVFQDTDLRLALRMLSTQGKRNIVAGKDITGSVTATFYHVTFEEALDAILRMNGYVFRQQDNFIYIYTPQQLADEMRATEELIVRAFRLYYVTAADAEALIAPALSEDGSVAITPAAGTGVGPDTISAGGNSYATGDVIIVRDYPTNIDIVAGIIEGIDVRPQQVLIEATILSAKLEEDNDLGVNFSTLSGIDFESLGSASTGVGNTTAGGLASTELKGMRAAGVRTGFDTISGGMTIGFLSNNVSVFISALESITDLTVLANPKLLVVNKQRGEVVVGARDGYRTTVVNQGISTEKIEFLETGTKLLVRPFIGSDDYVRLEIHPEDSDGTITNGLPSETTTEITSNVLVRDGHTIVIGGLFREEAQEARSQIPGLGNLPGAGVLFRNTKDKIERREIIVLITPHIIRQEVDEGVSEQIRDDVERFRVGQRKGLRWWGRSRLASTHMNWADQAYWRGDRAKAMWHVDLALSMDPRLIEAIRLKEELTQQAYWADETRVSTVQNVIQQMILHDLGHPLDELAPPNKPLRSDMLDEELLEAFGIIERVDKYRPSPEVGTDANDSPDN